MYDYFLFNVLLQSDLVKEKFPKMFVIKAIMLLGDNSVRLSEKSKFCTSWDPIRAESVSQKKNIINDYNQVWTRMQ